MLKTIFNFPKKYFFLDDLLAGITVGIVTIPQAMAFAMLAGIPPIYGLYGSFIPLFIYGFLSSSNYLNVGPVSIVSIFIFDVLSNNVKPFTTEYINDLVILGIMVGVIQFLFGVFGFGKFLRHIPMSIISGFIQAAAIIIIISQFTTAFGVEFPVHGLKKIPYLLTHLHELKLNTTLLFLISIIFLFLFAIFLPRFPTSIFLVLVTGILSYLFDFEKYGLLLIGEVPSGLPEFIFPTFSINALKYFPGALGLAIITSIGSSIMAIKLEPYQPKKIKLDREYMSLGLAKIISSFFGSMLSAGSFNRTILAYKIGGKTQITGIVSSIIILFTILYLTPVVYYFPQSVIAALIIYSVYFLFDFNLMFKLWREDKIELSYIFVTMAITLFIGLVEGILLGVFIKYLGDYIYKKIINLS
ncbi:MAG: SulP family inorganic anion transporter [Flavobacteriaceae bacterium]